jgi:DNA mismatch endonuclease, patch repair protein
MDIVSSAKRKEMMSGIRGKNTRPEILVRSSLHKMGFRYRLHARNLPGKPDLVFPKHSAVIFVNGCFWHGHQCHLFKWPKTRPEFWRTKITGNTERDIRNIDLLEVESWRIGIVWECALKGSKRQNLDDMLQTIGEWLLSSVDKLELSGRKDD